MKDVKAFITTAVVEIVSCFISFVISPLISSVVTDAWTWIVPEGLMLIAVHLIAMWKIRTCHPVVWTPGIAVNMIVVMILSNINSQPIIDALGLYGIDSRFSHMVEQPLGLSYWGDSVIFALLIFSFRMLLVIPAYCAFREKE